MKALKVTHELHDRRKSRNVGVGLTLAAFVAVLFALSVVKILQLGASEGFDQVVRPQMLPADGEGGE